MAKPGRKMGSIPWNKGLKGTYHIWPNGRKPFSKKTKKLISKAMKGRKAWNKGNPHLKIRGNNNPNWKGGITNENQILRSRIEFKNWKNKVFEINKKICIKCGSEKKLIAHHKEDFNKYPELRYDPKNGEIVCRSCHIKIHKPLRKNYV